MRTGGHKDHDDEAFDSDAVSDTSEDEMDGRTLEKIISDSNEKKNKREKDKQTKKPIVSAPRKKLLSANYSAYPPKPSENSSFAPSKSTSSSTSHLSSNLRPNEENEDNDEDENPFSLGPTMVPSTSSSSSTKTPKSSSSIYTPMASTYPQVSSFSPPIGRSSSSSSSPPSFPPFSTSSGLNPDLLRIPTEPSGEPCPIYHPGHVFLREVKLHETVSPGVDLFGVMFNSLNFSDKNDKEWLNQTLWSLFSVMAYDSVATCMSRTNSWEANILHVSKFEDILLNLCHMAYFKERLLAWLPNMELPTCFYDFLVDIRETKPSKKFIEDGKKITRDEDVIQISYFGSRIWNRCEEVRRLINGNLNPLWIVLTRTKSGSGHNNNAVIEGIRRCTWPMEAISRAQTNTKTQLCRLRNEAKKASKKPTDPIKNYLNENDDSQDEAAVSGVGGGGGTANEEATIAKDGKEQDPDETLPDFKMLYISNFRKVFPKSKIASYYPTYWLTFMLLGRPAGKAGRPPLEAGIIFCIYIYSINILLYRPAV